MVTSTDIVNQALQLVGSDQPPVTGVAPTFDSSQAGVAASYLYIPCVETVSRQFGWDFSRHTAVLSLSGGAAPFPYSYEYLYPTNGIQVRNIMPQTVTDRNNPLPNQWSVGNVQIGGTPAKVIWTNLASAQAVYTNQPLEGQWDALFRESVVRLLASEFAIALASRPDTARDKLSEGVNFETIGERRDS